MCWLSRNSRTLNLLQPSGSIQALIWIASALFDEVHQSIRKKETTEDNLMPDSACKNCFKSCWKRLLCSGALLQKHYCSGHIYYSPLSFVLLCFYPLNCVVERDFRSAVINFSPYIQFFFKSHYKRLAFIHKEGARLHPLMSLEASATICSGRTSDSDSLLCNKIQILSPIKLATGYVIKDSKAVKSFCGKDM